MIQLLNGCIPLNINVEYLVISNFNNVIVLFKIVIDICGGSPLL